MKKINFENAPSTNTPLSAENLNQMQNNIEEASIAISATEPATNEKVWIQKGKNLFDVNGLISQTGGGVTVTAKPDANSVNISGTPTAPYLFTLMSNFKPQHIFRMSINGNQYPTSNVRLGCTLYNAQGDVVTDLENTYAVNPSNYDFDHITIWLKRESNNVVMNNDVQILVTYSDNVSFEPYVEKAIYTKNANGVFEEFYSEENLEIYSTTERKIGKFYDGKTLYEKTIIINGNGTESVYYPLSIDNLFFAKVNYGKSYCGYGNASSFSICRTKDGERLDVAISDGWLNIVNIDGKDYTGWTFVVVVEYTKN